MRRIRPSTSLSTSEDGNGPRFDEEVALWIAALRAKLRFLERSGVAVELA
jgi:hypothetical protein